MRKAMEAVETGSPPITLKMEGRGWSLEYALSCGKASPTSKKRNFMNRLKQKGRLEM